MSALAVSTRPVTDGWTAELLARCHFPAPDAGPVALAVSGGADSTALMVLAGEAGLTGTVIHVDHGLRPGSSAEAALVERAAQALGFSFRSEQVVVERGPDLEARARRARYAVLPAGVLTGHTMDDQAETVLLNLLRGAALDGLAGMRTPLGGEPVRVRRPLLGLRRAETAELCRRRGLDPVADPSNQDRRFRRNRVRAELVPLVSQVAERDIVPVLARQAALLGEDADLLDQMAAGLDPTDVAALRAAPPPLARRSLRAWLRDGPEQHPPSAAELARVMDVVAGRHQACQLAGGRRVDRRRGRLYLHEPEPAGGDGRVPAAPPPAAPGQSPLAELGQLLPTALSQSPPGESPPAGREPV